MEQGSQYVVTQYLVSLIPHKPNTPTTAPRWSIEHVPSPLCKIQMVINLETLPQEIASCNYWALTLKPCKLREKFTVHCSTKTEMLCCMNTWGNEITCQDRQFCPRRWVLGLWSKQVVRWYVTMRKKKMIYIEWMNPRQHKIVFNVKSTPKHNGSGYCQDWNWWFKCWWNCTNVNSMPKNSNNWLLNTLPSRWLKSSSRDIIEQFNILWNLCAEISSIYLSIVYINYDSFQIRTWSFIPS